MEVLPSHKLLFRLSLLLPIHITSLMLISSAYSPPDNYFINCGANSKTNVTTSGTRTRVFIGDRGFLVGKAETVKNNNPTASTSLDLYQAARIFRHQALYKFNIYQTGTYIVRLHFFVFMSLYTDRPIPRFNVSVFGHSLLTNYSFQNMTSSPKIEEFLLTIPKGKFKIFFVPYQNSSAFVNAIEVFLGPESFIPDEAPYITSQGAKNNYSHLSSKVLHKVHRIDVGEDSIS
ncbi:probable receptor-like protein kinase At5g24010 [Carya illinoinensis]|uniref:probable receptor-like protein kinase At5g24010 n=1 Tax=Carya illinoinensis TaxID=32201 RepID=UPI001C71E188|nr:probable receptor-like protein kinase At5g24010 [Carya illinoinensis]